LQPMRGMDRPMNLEVLMQHATVDELRVIVGIMQRANDRPAILVTTQTEGGRRYVVSQSDEPIVLGLIGLSSAELAERVKYSNAYVGARWMRGYGNVDEMYRSLGVHEITSVRTADRSKVWGH
jgi:hypothetical protein